MDIATLTAWLTENLPEDQAKIVRDAVNRDSVKSRASGLKEQKEFDAILAQQAQVQAELDAARPGAEWVTNNRAYLQLAIERDKKIQEFDAKHGAGAFQAMLEGRAGAGNPNPANPNPNGLSPEDLQRQIDERFTQTFAPNVSKTVKSLGKIMQRHLLAGRKNEIDMDAVEKLMVERGVDVEAAYAEWDRPEREKHETTAREAEIKRRVEEEIQKRGVVTNWPGGADATPGVMSAKGGDGKFDKSALEADLVQTFMRGTAEKVN